jgi:hypothetical protein
MKSRLIILVGFLSLHALNSATPVPVAYREALIEAKASLARGEYKKAGTVFYSLAQNLKAGGPNQPESRPGTKIAQEADQELCKMIAAGQWNDGMLQ